LTDNDIMINVLLDRSGSMGGLEKDVIGHYNAYIKEQRYLPGRATVSHVLFDDRYEEIYVGKDIKEVPKLTKDTYSVRGSTAYLDAIGKLVNSVDAIKNKPKKVIFVINTDGLENASREFTASKIKEIITERQNNHDWQFVFIGAGFDAIKEGLKYGIPVWTLYSAAAGPQGITDSYTMLSNSTIAYRAGDTVTMDMTTTPRKKTTDDTTTPVVTS